MQRKKPPKFAEKILEVLSSSKKTGILGDTEEEYRLILQEKSRIKAYMWYVRQIIQPLPLYIRSHINGSIIMFKNYLKTAWRSIRKHKGYSFINIAGLSIGIAVCLFILLWVKDEASYDRFHKHIDHLYRLTQDQTQGGGEIFKVAVTPAPIGPALKKDYAAVVEFCRLRPIGRNLITVKGKNFYEEDFLFVDPSFLKMFTFPLVSGNTDTVLDDPSHILLTESTAEKYFGTEDPVGQTITYSNYVDFLVAGVLKDVPDNSHIRFNFLGNFQVVIDTFGNSTDWWNNYYYTYVQLDENTDADRIRAEVAPYLKKISPTSRMKIGLQPVKDIYLRSDYAIDLYSATHDKSQYVYIFTAVALIVLLLACINFMNLATARAGLRGKEVGLRKVVGARRAELIRQFFGESILFSIVACLFAFGLVRLLLPSFNNLTAKSIDPGVLIQPEMLLFVAGIALLSGFVSGVYPALYLSAFQPIVIFRGKSGTKSGSALFRKALVVFQFTLSIVFISGTFIIGDQLKFLRSRDLGLDKEAVIHFRLRGSLNRNYTAFKNDLLKTAGISGVGAGSDIPTYTIHSTTGFEWEGKDPESRLLVHQFAVDPDYLPVLGIELKEGRPFDQDMTRINSAFIVNETLAEAIGYKDNAVGRFITLWNIKAPIVGVVKDFHFKSLHTEIEPLVMRLEPRRFRYVFVKIDTCDLRSSLAAVERVYKEHNPEYPFEFGFLDESLNALYHADRRVGALFNIFTGLAISISCLGLLGLASFLIDRRRKEICIRKIIGADLGRILILLSKDFLKWVTAAAVLAIPIAAFAMNRWLQNFAYRTKISAGTFVLSLVLALGIAIITISYHSLRAARTNPAESLRHE